MSAVEILRQASTEARRNGFNGMNRFEDALADWWLTRGSLSAADGPTPESGSYDELEWDQ